MLTCISHSAWESSSGNEMTSSFFTKKKRINVDIIQCFAQTNDSEEEETNNFYNRL
ncbi:hypothetical protein DPMN_178807 [Dreissena polymorpha]|uniref:Uncharacterized protein n=1 Tax=Dreissena polymorpha TaxID=45954 RepID=A0A9D4IJ05_DREPO|nr:hypothetical protein DPMN_178807 [Dreissena polymorpha]